MFVLITRRRLFAAVAVCAAVAVGVVGLSLAQPTVTTSAGATDWGLSFQQEGMPPVGNATAAQLAQYDAYYCGDAGQKRLYLTFDAGYENGYTATILDTLKARGVPAAFFVVGHYLDSAPDLVRRMVAEGHIVANHTYSHPDMSALGEATAFVDELVRVEESFAALTGQKMPKFYRPPRGKYSLQNLKMAQDAGYRTFFWSLAYVDWQTDHQPSREQALNKLVERIHPGAVVLLHSTSATNAQVLDEVIGKWQEMGYTFGTLAELCGDQGV